MVLIKELGIVALVFKSDKQHCFGLLLDKYYINNNAKALDIKDWGYAS